MCRRGVVAKPHGAPGPKQAYTIVVFYGPGAGAPGAWCPNHHVILDQNNVGIEVSAFHEFI